MGWEGIDLYRNKWRREVRAVAGQLVGAELKKVGAYLSAKVVDGTPVDEGEARHGWHWSVGAPTFANKRSDALEQSLGEALQTSDLFPTLFLQNNVDHILVLEYGLFVPPDPGPSKDPRPGRLGEVLVSRGFSTQAPRGILGDAVAATAARFNLQTE